MVNRLYFKNANINMTTGAIAAMVKEDGISPDRILAALANDDAIRSHFRPMDDPKAFRKDFIAIEQHKPTASTTTVRQSEQEYPPNEVYEEQQTITVDDNGNPIF